MLLLLGIFLLLLVAVDVGARLTAESQLEARLSREVPEAGSTDVGLHSFPFLARLLLGGQVSRVTAEVTDLRVERLTFARVSVELHDVRVDREALFGDRQLDLERIGSGSAEAEVTQEALSAAVGVPVVLEPGRVGVRVAGRTVSVSASVRDGDLVLAGVGIPLPRLTIPSLPLVDCPPSAEALAGRLVLSCNVEDVPEELLRNSDLLRQ